nr:hypothetical protein [Planctomycetota bacterium]
EYERTPHGWLPVAWTVEQINPGSERMLLGHKEMRVASYQMNPPVTRDDFHVEPTQGMYVRDARDKRAQKRIIHTGAGSPPLDAVAEWRRQHRPTEVKPSPWPWVLTWGGVGCLGIALLAWGVRKYRAT